MRQEKILCAFGKQIEIRLIQMSKTNEWLIDKVACDTGLYFDRSYLYKIKTGKSISPRIVESICRILGIESTPGRQMHNTADSRPPE